MEKIKKLSSLQSVFIRFIHFYSSYKPVGKTSRHDFYHNVAVKVGWDGITYNEMCMIDTFCRATKLIKKLERESKK